MKKIFTLLLPAFFVFSFKPIAQTSPVCNAAFNFSFLNSNSLKFTPAVNGDSPLVHHEWVFGDASSVSHFIAPTHTYSAPGTYSIKHYLSRYTSSGVFVCADTIIKQVVIQPACNLTAYFAWSIVAGNPFTAGFENLSTPITSTDSVRWTFGDGTSSLDMNVKHTYAKPGTYNACLRVKKNGNGQGTEPCVREFCKTVIINQPCDLLANFNWSPVTASPLSFTFQNLSTPIANTDSVRWTFGDGSSSLDINTKHTYANSGTYKVCLRVKKNGNAPGTEPCVREICKTIIINPPCNLLANFNWSPVTASPLSFTFQNLSTPIAASDSVRWTFGDGTSSLDVNPKHTFANPGTYNVCLRVKKNGNATGTEPCVREICKTIIINPPCNLLANFNWSPVTASPLSFSFQNLSTPISSTDSVRWTFGDGTSSLDINAKHTYNHAGTYTVCLRVKKNSNIAGTASCVGEICKTITILSQSSCDTVHLSYAYQKDPAVPNKIYFKAISNVSISDQSWTIARQYNATQPPAVLHQNNPAYVFHDTGYYRICLRAITLSGCVKEYCNNIRIERLVESCDLQAFPNPAHTQVNVAVILVQPQLIKAYVYNGMNIMVKDQQQTGNTGNNLVTINVNDLLPGLYTIKFIYGNRTCYARFTKF